MSASPGWTDSSTSCKTSKTRWKKPPRKQTCTCRVARSGCGLCRRSRPSPWATWAHTLWLGGRGTSPSTPTPARSTGWSMTTSPGGGSPRRRTHSRRRRIWRTWWTRRCSVRPTRCCRASSGTRPPWPSSGAPPTNRGSRNCSRPSRRSCICSTSLGSWQTRKHKRPSNMCARISIHQTSRVALSCARSWPCWLSSTSALTSCQTNTCG
mmetsp:Transcript_50337/g.126099  ORF Transcript_50337/g.126099 Transcript_50337/m.126099 type:complete len:209 (-) Transcript_50337:2050-2676(-)